MRKIIFFTIITLFLIYTFRENINETFINAALPGGKGVGPHNIPKVIWTYWNEGTPPKLVQLCMNGWKRLNPDFKIVLIKRNTVTDIIQDPLPENFNSFSPQRQSDWIRLAVLKNFGGYWLDSTIMLTCGLAAPVSPKNTADGSGVAYFNPFHTIKKSNPIIETWFIGVQKGNIFIEAWFIEFDRVCKKFGNDGSGYIRELQREYPSRLTEIVANIPSGHMQNYLTIYICASKISIIDNFNPLKYFTLQNCFDGPFFGCTKEKWRSLSYLCDFLFKGFSPLPPDKLKMVKFINHERKFIEEYLSRNNYLCENGSLYDTLLEKCNQNETL